MGDYASSVPEKPKLLDQLRSAIPEQVKKFGIRLGMNHADG
jgi:hypothetical protein